MAINQCISPTAHPARKSIFRRGLILISFALLSCGWTSPADRVQVVPTPNNGQVPDAEVDKDGTIHLAYVLSEDAYYSCSTDHGKTFSAPLRINSVPGTVHPANMYRGPDLALGKNGAVHVIWYVNAYQRKLPHDEWGVFYSHLNRDKTAFVPSRNLNHTPSDNYSMAANDNGDLAVVWMADGLFVNSSPDNGNTFAHPERVALADPCECCASRAYFSSERTLYISYREKANNLRDMHLLVRARGEPRFRKEKIGQTSWQINACPMTGTFLTAAKKSLVMAWETKGQIFYSRLNPRKDLGQPGEMEVATQGKWPVALAASDGTVLVSWKTGSTLNWQLQSAADTPLGPAESKPGRNANRHAGVLTKKGTLLLID